MLPAAPAPIPTTLAGAPWLVRPETRAVLAALAAAGHEARIVGGAVRNALLGEPVNEIDIATTGTPDEVIEAARVAGLQAIPTGASHGTVTVVSNHVPYEVTTLREDVETFGRHARVAFTADWAADARRRDFTINALYCDADGTISDPIVGLPDLAARRVRFIGDARARIREDALRILRFFRFHARYSMGPIDAEGLAACAAERHMLAHLSAERVRAELLKLLEAPGAAHMIAVMAAHGFIVAILGRAPRIGTLARLVAQDSERRRPADPLLRLSVLAVAVEEDRLHLAERLRLSREEARSLVVLDPRLMALAALDDRGRRRALYAAGPEAWRRMVMAGRASAETAADIAAWDALEALPEQWSIPEFPLGGRDALALGLAPGPAIGALLADLEAEWIADDFALDADGLRARLASRARDSR
ncbi:MAG TPA: CCA tRNA nucleotidyltransferase [Hyphomicrobiaceae bacterium]|jgi:poly(A) polymerase|nr:CCA tRNA nucleotidyltransferase [Hyphomicrobiaceae bacterium]